MTRLFRVISVVLGLLAVAYSGVPLMPTSIAQSTSESPAPLYFTIGMHIEPLGTTHQGFNFTPGGADYHNEILFQRHVEDILAVAAIVEAHGGRMTIQTQSPFTDMVIETGNTIFADLEARGHEIGLHFHEDNHLGRNPESLPVSRWCDVMKEEIGLIYQAGVKNHVRYWSGGNLYPNLLEAASCAELDVNSDWKNPYTQTTDLLLIGVNPWRPAGGVSISEDGSVDVSTFAQHDPNGRIIFLPEGNYSRTDFASVRKFMTEEEYFEFLRESLERSLEAARPDRVNVFHFTVHPGEFGGADGSFSIIEQFLTNVVDPLVASGKVRWATFGEMAASYKAWEAQQASQDRRTPRRHLRPASPHTSQNGYVTFVVNVHEWRHPDESAATLSRLVDLFEKYGVRGDFYFTPEITRELALKYPNVVDKLRHSQMTISYHVRPPHPAYEGFETRLLGLGFEELYQTLLQYETYKLNLETGELEFAEPGGYLYVTNIFGRKPVVASVPNGNPEIKDAGQRVYRDLGARMTVLYHERGTSLDNPFVFVNGLLVRPADFSITRTTKINGLDNFWWNYMTGPDAWRYQPKAMLQEELAAWAASGASRPPFILSHIHENDFVRRGEEWSWIYYTMEEGRRGDPLPPPWNLQIPDHARVRPVEEQEAIWQAYEDLVAYAASRLQVVTSEDIVRMAQTETEGAAQEDFR